MPRHRDTSSEDSDYSTDDYSDSKDEDEEEGAPLAGRDAEGQGSNSRKKDNSRSGTTIIMILIGLVQLAIGAIATFIHYHGATTISVTNQQAAASSSSIASLNSVEAAATASTVTVGNTGGGGGGDTGGGVNTNGGIGITSIPVGSDQGVQGQFGGTTMTPGSTGVGAVMLPSGAKNSTKSGVTMLGSSLGKSSSTGSAALPTSGNGAKSSTTSSTKPTSTPPNLSPVSPSTTCAKGIGYNDAILTSKLNICWAYNWGSSQSGLGSGVEFVPMLWGTKGLGDWTDKAQAGIASGSKFLMGFNEPDGTDQANLPPASAASIWKSAMQPFATSAGLISPAVTNGPSPMGVAWLQSWIAACAGGCEVVAFALHWYSPCNPGAVTNFQTYFTNAYSTLKKPIWITEFMCIGSAADQQTFLTAILPWIKSQSFITRYAAFGDFTTAPPGLAIFVDTSGNPTPVGGVYAAYQ